MFIDSKNPRRILIHGICVFLTIDGGIGPGPASYRVLSDTVGTQQRLTKTTLKGRTGARAGLGFGILEVPCESQGTYSSNTYVGLT